MAQNDRKKIKNVEILVGVWHFQWTFLTLEKFGE